MMREMIVFSSGGGESKHKNQDEFPGVKAHMNLSK